MLCSKACVHTHLGMVAQLLEVRNGRQHPGGAYLPTQDLACRLGARHAQAMKAHTRLTYGQRRYVGRPVRALRGGSARRRQRRKAGVQPELGFRQGVHTGQWFWGAVGAHLSRKGRGGVCSAHVHVCPCPGCVTHGRGAADWCGLARGSIWMRGAEGNSTQCLMGIVFAQGVPVKKRAQLLRVSSG